MFSILMGRCFMKKYIKATFMLFCMVLILTCCSTDDSSNHVASSSMFPLQSNENGESIEQAFSSTYYDDSLLTSKTGFESKFGLSYDFVHEQYSVTPTFPEGGYSEKWSAEQTYDYVGHDLIDKLDSFFGESKERIADDNSVYFYMDGTVSMNTKLSYVSPGSEGEYGFELTIWVNHDRMDEYVEWKYPIGDPNNEIQGIPVWLGWSQNCHGAFDAPDTKTDITLLAAFSMDGTYYFLEQQPVSENGDGEGLFLNVLQTILTTENQ